MLQWPYHIHGGSLLIRSGIYSLPNDHTELVFSQLILLVLRVCKSGYPLSGYPDLSVNFMAAKNPDILVANPDIRCPDLSVNFMALAAKNLILEF